MSFKLCSVAGLSEEDLQLLSCTLFIGCCASYCTGTLADDVSRNLQVNSNMGKKSVFANFVTRNFFLSHCLFCEK